MAGAFGGHHHHIHLRGGHNLAKVDVKAVGKGEHIARRQVGGNIFFVNLLLHFIGQQNHHPVGGFGRFRHGLYRQPFGLGFGGRAAAFIEAHNDVDAAVLKVEGVGMPLGAVTNDGYGFAIE